MCDVTTGPRDDDEDLAADGPPPRRRRGRPSGSSGRELLSIARQHFLAHGFRRTTTDAIAAQAKVSKQTLYAQYPSKDALFAAVVRDWVDQGHDALAPHARALVDSDDMEAALRHFAGILQTGILSEPVLKMRALVAAEADTLPDVAADYVRRSWDHNLSLLADAFSTLTQRDLLDVDDPTSAAEQFVWLVIGAPLNRLELTPARRRDSPRHLGRIAEQGVRTFLSRFRPLTP
jgi:TetR/AcrR family transcriptional regulator, mexJK operon transcriptional repressor